MKNLQLLVLIVVVPMVVVTLLGFKSRKSDNDIPVYIREFGVEIRQIDKLGDTLFYNKSSKENFKFIFYDVKGKCYCERYINGKLYQKGNYESSLDTLKRYVSGRDLNGLSSAITVQMYFEPLKNGEWNTYKNGKQIKENYLMGVLQNEYTIQLQPSENSR